MADSVFRRILPVLIGMALTVVLLFALAYINRQRAGAGHPTPPDLRILTPSQLQPADSPLVIRFASQRPLELKASGWGTGSFHLHARVNGVEHMPAAADVTHTDSSYAWTIAAVPRGRITIRLGWADQAHRELRTGQSELVTATLR